MKRNEPEKRIDILKKEAHTQPLRHASDNTVAPTLGSDILNTIDHESF